MEVKTNEATQLVTHSLFSDISSCVPAMRLIVVSAWAELADGPERPRIWHAISPVIAIRTCVKHVYHQECSVDDDPPVCRTHAEMIENGWEYEGSHLEHMPLVLDESGGLSGVDDHVDGSDVYWRVVVCEWPEAEDKVRLADEIRKTEDAAVEMVTALRNLDQQMPNREG